MMLKSVFERHEMSEAHVAGATYWNRDRILLYEWTAMSLLCVHISTRFRTKKYSRSMQTSLVLAPSYVWPSSKLQFPGFSLLSSDYGKAVVSDVRRCVPPQTFNESDSEGTEIKPPTISTRQPHTSDVLGCKLRMNTSLHAGKSRFHCRISARDEISVARGDKIAQIAHVALTVFLSGSYLCNANAN